MLKSVILTTKYALLISTRFIRLVSYWMLLSIWILNRMSFWWKVLAFILRFWHLLQLLIEMMVWVKYCVVSRMAARWPTDIEDYIAVVLELSMMTEKEKKIAIAVAQYSNISAVATFLNANNKTVYSRVGVIARKLNLQHVTEVRQFIGIEIA